ncbi:hypothetical protein BUALT_Bualt02G0024500 [Buddleja alternifolia]|uniref:Pollen Ole e 1 allergen and extensin family protein n=1 Tax=Buddleja alternifolia TaxID=168488 RepID=A0AAV6Y3Z5_9LAMI|nr:hypothetical protein BUALT_Bualt02G0024500 [Buddleja alternifolia]
MAQKTLFICIFVAIMATSIAEAQELAGTVYVNGTLYCTANGDPGPIRNTTPIFANAAMQVNCSGDVISNSPATATTNAIGAYRVVLTPRPTATVDSIVSNCRLFVLTPLSNCNPTLPSAGLVSNLRFDKTATIPLFYIGGVPVAFSRVTFMIATGFTPQA